MKLPLYRDKERGVLFGTCAGLSNSFAISVIAIRVICIFAVFLPFFRFIALLYLLSPLLIKKAPRTEGDDAPQQQKYMIDALTSQCQELDQRIRRIENVVTSDEFQIRQKISRL